METALKEILTLHSQMYPRMEAADYIKLIYQNEFGPGHLKAADAEIYLREEYAAMTAEDRPLPPRVEPIGNGLCRLYFGAELAPSGLMEVVARLVSSTAAAHHGTEKAFEKKIEALEELAVEGILPLSPGELSVTIARYRAAGAPVPRHSDAYRSEYRPHYRVIKAAYGDFYPVFQAVQERMNRKQTLIAAIDGRCGSGKTFLARLLAEGFDCPVLHLDDFFLTPEAKTPERLAQPGGNVDYERFWNEVLRPLTRGEAARFRPYDCGTGAYRPEVIVPPGGLILVEGSYSQHPALWESYDLRIFLTCSPEEQTARLRRRCGEELLQRFRQEWIPLEERYFEAFAPDRQADLALDTTEFFHAAAFDSTVVPGKN